MSTAVTTGATHPPAPEPSQSTSDPTGHGGSGRRLPFSRLVRAELRKTVDTRSGRWLLAAMTIAVVGAIVLGYVYLDRADQSLRTFLLLTSTPIGIVVPLLGILSVTSEWGQRTGLVTFALEPRRLRVIAAKTLGVVLLGLGLLAVAVVVAAGANALAAAVHDAPGSWDLGWARGGGFLLLTVVFLVQGVAFGLAFLNGPAAIVTYLVLPTVWTIVAGLVPALRTASQWLDLNVTSTPLADGAMTATGWGQLGVSVAVWVVLPFVLGCWRVVRHEFR